MGYELLRCRSCGELFVFTAGERKFYSERQLNTPCRCTECHQAWKEKPDPYEWWQSTMGGYKPAKRGHKRVQYSGVILAGGMSQ